MITLERYNRLPLEEKIEMLICKGEYIDTVEKFDYETWLYVLEGIYIEVVYSIAFNQIEEVRVISDAEGLEEYVRSLDITALVA